MTSCRQFEDELVKQLPSLRRSAVALVGNATLADDLVQDCIERALRSSRQLRDPARLSAWLWRILRNRYIDELRRWRTRGEEEEILELTDTLEVSAPPVDTVAVRDLIGALNALSVEHREILILVSVEELPYREIANRLDIPIGTVMSRLARAREHLRTILRGGAAEVIPLSSSRK